MLLNKKDVFGCTLACLLFFIAVSPVHADSFTDKFAQIETVELLDKKIERFTQLQQDSNLTAQQQIKVYIALSVLYHQNNDLNAALAQSEQALKIAKDHQLLLEQAQTEHRLGVIHYLMGNNAQALIAYQNAEQLYSELDEPLLQANTFNNLGLVHAAMSNIDQALKYYKFAQPIYNELGSEKDKVDIVFNIAGLYLRLKQNAVAIKMYRQVIEQREQLNDIEGLALAYGDLGSTYKNDGQYELGEEYLQKSLQYYLKKNDYYNAASQSHNLAELYSSTLQLIKAKDYANQAVTMSLQASNQAAYAGSLYTLAKLAYLDKEFSLALEYLAKSDQISVHMVYKLQLEENLTLYALVLSAQQQSNSALQTLQKYKDKKQDNSDKQLQDKLAQYQALLDAEQLNQQLVQLKQAQKIDALNLDQTMQQRNFTIMIALLLLLATFLLFRRAMAENARYVLSKKVEQRSVELEQISKQLQRASEVKSQFLANMSHEIRTPLTAVMGQAELIINGDIPVSEIKDEVKIIHNNSLHLLELINDILDLTRIEANKLILDRAPADVVALGKEVVHMFCESAKQKGLKLSFQHFLCTPYYIAMDKVRLKQILINLCSNAVKFTEQGEVKVEVWPTSSGLKFIISDTGIGMTNKQLGNIFNSFTQGDNTISRRFGGSGLGLCLSEQLANLMGGSISVTSELGKGSIFTLHLTCQQLVDHQPIAEAEKSLASCHETKFEGTVLLAEDHEDNRRLITLMLEKLGLSVIGAENGKQAVEIALKSDIDIILLDIQMPQMDGIAAFKLLRQCGMNLPIIALTANAMSHEVQHYYDLGFNDHLKKPIEREAFVATLAKHLNIDDDTRSAGNQLVGIDMSDLVARFANSFPDELSELSLHMAALRYTDIGLQAHKLAGAAAMFGFHELAACAQYLEKVIKYEDYSEVADAVAELQAQLVMQKEASK
ncbi:response regulator [Pseudoalteromonas tunicata]|uniref:histidine kinase n=1 Tax=Pseudoalteromonas tunicata D2 TaxID=87626 RepID=A4CFB3_9GAMM|nr:response regulator [Pseudoalteromonas tunicata]ATC92952.1 hypothetical protein PTUN_a0113 [Pseudoalteromonas tunicata]AXT32051.1 hybrid sensor histidine kinase/response regulator [Pseudoalteromonas tunicata]EAR26551.1 sensor histidine kinase/response regulator [Pseudoalteromonas tunicata D2]